MYFAGAVCQFNQFDGVTLNKHQAVYGDNTVTPFCLQRESIRCESR